MKHGKKLKLRYHGKIHRPKCKYVTVTFLIHVNWLGKLKKKVVEICSGGDSDLAEWSFVGVFKTSKPDWVWVKYRYLCYPAAMVCSSLDVDGIQFVAFETSLDGGLIMVSSGETCTMKTVRACVAHDLDETLYPAVVIDPKSGSVTDDTADEFRLWTKEIDAFVKASGIGHQEIWGYIDACQTHSPHTDELQRIDSQ